MDKKWLMSGDDSAEFMDKKGKLKRIEKFTDWRLQQVLVQKYKLRENEALMLASFLSKMLKWKPCDRASAQEMLKHPWLKMAPNYNTCMTKLETREYQRKHGLTISKSSSEGDAEGWKDETSSDEEEDDDSSSGSSSGSGSGSSDSKKQKSRSAKSGESSGEEESSSS